MFRVSNPHKFIYRKPQNRLFFIFYVWWRRMFLLTQAPPSPPRQKEVSSSIEIHTLCRRLGISSVCWDLQTRSAKRKIPCNLTMLNFDFINCNIVSNLRDNIEIGQTFVFRLLRISPQSWSIRLKIPTVADVPWPVGDWLPFTCMQDAETSEWDWSLQFFCMLEKGFSD